MVESGFVLYANVSGFPAVASAFEQGHAAGHRESLLSAVADQLFPGFDVQPLDEGHLFATSLDGDLPRSAVLLDLIEQAFVAFRSVQSQMQNDTCTCPACRDAPDARLAFLVLRGMWTRLRGTGAVISCSDDAQIAGAVFESVADSHTSRLLVTSGALTRMGVKPELAGMHLHQAAASAFRGQEAVWSLDLDPVWESAAESTVRVDVANVVATMEVWLPVSQPNAWDWLTAPDKRTLWEDVDTIESFPRADRRLGVGTRYHSVQLGYVDEVREVLDWKPFRYWTWDLVARGLRTRTTIELTSVDGGTRVVSTMGLPSGIGSVQRMRARREIKQRLAPRREAAFQRLRVILEVERAVPDASGGRAEPTATFRAGAG